VHFLERAFFVLAAKDNSVDISNERRGELSLLAHRYGVLAVQSHFARDPWQI
jgi:hypothetical protein